MTQATSNSGNARWSLDSRLTLAISLALVLFSALQLAYRSSLPTDGWSVVTDDPQASTWVYTQNLVGTPSPLRENDTLIAVEGQTLLGRAMVSPALPPPNWAAGSQVMITVLRAGQEISFLIPVVHWTLLAWWRSAIANLNLLTGLLGSLVLLVTGFYTFVRRPDLPDARCLVLLCAAIGASSVSGMLPDGLSVQFDRLVFWPVAFFNYAIFGSLVAPALLAFALYFPRSKRAVQRRPWLGLAPFAFGLVLLLALIAGVPSVLGWISTPVMIVAAIAALVHSAFTQRDAVSRAQLRWAVWGAAVGLGVALLTFPAAFGWISDPLLAKVLSAGAVSLGFTIFGIALAVAVLRYGLWGIDIIINRTLVYVPLTAIVAGIFAAAVSLSQKAFIAVTGQDSLASTVLATLIVVALFNPIKDRVQRVVDKRFKEVPGPNKRLNAFQEQLRSRLSQVDVRPITRRFLEEAVSAFDAECGVAYVDERGGWMQIHSTGECRGGDRLSVPVECAGERIACIALGTRRHGHAYSATDRRALEEAAQAVGQAIEEDGSVYRLRNSTAPA